MCRSAFVVREINLAIVRPVMSCGHYPHMRPCAFSVLFREQESALIQPSQPGRIGKKKALFTAQNGNSIGVPSHWVALHDRIGQPRAIRGERHSVFLTPIVCELDGLTI